LAKLRRKDLLKRQDEFLNKSWGLLEWGKAHTRTLLWGGIGLLLALLAVVAAKSYSQSYEQAAEQAFTRARSLYSMALRSSDPDLDASAIAALRAVAQEYDNSSSAAQAGVCLAHLFMERQQYNQALPLLEQLGDKSGLPAELVALIQGTKGQCLEQLGRLDEAETAYRAAAAASGGNSSASWNLALARVLAQQGKTEPAKALYEQIAATSLSPFLRDAASLALAAMEVPPPQPPQ
jgi:predicted negative regulator of RcsB-dependent stress response